MAGFDPSLDEEIFSKKAEFDNTVITVSVMSYNKGAKKLQVSRQNISAAGEPKWAKLGRLTKDEAQAILPLMQEALDKMD